MYYKGHHYHLHRPGWIFTES